MKRFGVLGYLTTTAWVAGFCLCAGCSDSGTTSQRADRENIGEQAPVSATVTVAKDLQPPQELALATDQLVAVGAEQGTSSGADSKITVAQVGAVQPASPQPEFMQPGTPAGGAAPPATIDVPEPSTPPVQSDQSASSRYREPLFVDWPTPKVAIMLTGRQHGYMEPCGCSGLENQNGGLVRRSTLLKQLRDKSWSVIPVDAGNQVRRFGRQAEIKYQFTIQGMKSMGYQAIGFGPDDLRLPAPELLGVIINNSESFVCANVKIFDDSSFAAPFRVFNEGNKKVGLTMVLGERNLQQVNNGDITSEAAEAALKRVVPELEKAKCDLNLLIAHATIEESKKLAQEFPQFGVVVTTGGAGEPTREPVVIEGTKTWMIEVGTKGMFAGVIALFDDAAKPLRYQRIPLDSRFPDSKEMLQLLAEYQEQLKLTGFEGLGITAQPLPGNATFVGSKVCDDCHDKEYKIWKQGVNGQPAKHSHAYATLEHPPNSRGGIPRNYDPECISCHVVGWNPQKYFPYKSGFVSLAETPELTDVGCENCHGPGSQHVAAENGDIVVDDAQLEKLREEMWLDLEDAERRCLECHDLDNSPSFQEEGAFEKYWKKIEH